jgi:hypothetical protein
VSEEPITIGPGGPAVRYRCACGYETDNAPSGPNHEIVTVYHLHRRTEMRGPAEIVRMEPVEDHVGLRRDPEVVGAT